MQFEVVLNDSHHAICSDGRVYLDSDSSLCRTPKGLDFEMLFNPFKEEFYTPTIFVEESNLCGRYLHIVGQVDKCLKESNLCGRYLHIVGQVDKCLVLVSCIVCDATKNGRIFLSGKVIRKSDNLVRKNNISIMHGVTFANDLILKISSLPYHKVGLQSH